MYLKHFLSGVSVACLLALPAMAAEPLQPRGEVSVKGGADRSLLTTEFWAPIAQESDRVLYGDIRLMGDNDENREGNLGIGYRQIKGNAVYGGHAWIDRRRTQYNSTFHQMTFGVERLGHRVDARANLYVPLNQGRTVITPNIGSSAPYLVGSGIFYDTNGSISETPQYGVDGELGYRIPIFQKQVDALRVYGGGYHFFRNGTDNVTGFRIRSEAQINKIISVGARYQYDEPRGSQGFLEATLKFPFSAKKLYQTDALRSRLDESPERDVDIVTDAKVDTGIAKPIINTTSGQQQRVIYVDNSNTLEGDGTRENPFNNLGFAQAAMQDNDIIYINHGDGTSNRMDQGITINKANVQLIGSGSNFVYDSGRFTSATGDAPASGTLILAKTAAPVITNNQASVDLFTGNGITNYADNFSVSGITVSGAQGRGIYVLVDNGTVWNSFTANNLTLMNNISGIYMNIDNGARVGNIDIQNVNASNNNAVGILIRAYNNAVVDNISLSSVATNNNVGGTQLNATTNAKFGTININNLSTNNNTGSYGLNIISQATGSLIDNLNVSNVTANNNALVGVRVSVANPATLNNAMFQNIIVNNNGSNGMAFDTRNASTVGNITVQNITANNNLDSGILVTTVNTGTTINKTTITNATTNGNTNHGIFVYANNGAVLNTTLNNITANGNTVSGIHLYSNGASAANSLMTNTQITNATTNNNGASGIYVRANLGIIDQLLISNAIARNNTEYGLYFYSQQTSSVISNAQVSFSDAISNTLGGIYVRKATAAATLNLDLGNGFLSNAGQNRFYGNTGNDLIIDRAVVTAGSNWWNNGGAAPSRVTLNSGATASYPTPLATNPRP